MNNRQTELHTTAATFVEDLLGLHQGERVLIYADELSDPAVSGAIRDCAERLGAVVDWLELSPSKPRRSGVDAEYGSLQDAEFDTPSRSSGACHLFGKGVPGPDWDLPTILKELTDRIERNRYDAVCELSEQYFYPTAVWARAVELGGRVYRLGAIDAGAFVRCVGQVDQERMYAFGLVLRRTLRQATSACLVTDAGTDLRFELKSGGLTRRVLSRLGLRKRPWVGLPSGRLTAERRSTFLGGQLPLLGIPETIQGIAVVDGYLWPPQAVGRLDAPITLTIHRGKVTGISGGRQAQELSQWLQGKDTGVKHFCIGFSPGARPSGTITEAERAFGCWVVGFGTFPFHTDGVIKAPTVWLDGAVIEDEGSFVGEGLSTLGNDLKLA